MTRDELLLAIVNCPEIDQARGDAGHPCAGIVGLQQPAQFQKPEPWRGHIDTAPILFVSSNPSIRGKEAFPPADWKDQHVINHYQRCFDDDASIPGHIDKATYNSVRYWTGARARAKEILGRPAKQGTDFALTELVHCKSTNERGGVTQALRRCAERWLEPVMHQSAAVIIMLMGKHAHDAAARVWQRDCSQPCVHFDVSIGGRSRALVILPHPNFHGPQKIEHYLAVQEQLPRLRALLPPEYR